MSDWTLELAHIRLNSVSAAYSWEQNDTPLYENPVDLYEDATASHQEPLLEEET